MYKQIILPAEIVRVRGRKLMEVFNSIEAKSLLQWDINFIVVSKPTIKTVRIWNNFKNQLITKEFYIIYDFKVRAKSRMKISECEKYVRYEIEDKQIMVFKVILLNEYKIISEYDILVDQIDCIG